MNILFSDTVYWNFSSNLDPTKKAYQKIYISSEKGYVNKNLQENGKANPSTSFRPFKRLEKLQLGRCREREYLIR